MYYFKISYLVNDLVPIKSSKLNLVPLIYLFCTETTRIRKILMLRYFNFVSSDFNQSIPLLVQSTLNFISKQCILFPSNFSRKQVQLKSKAILFYYLKVYRFIIDFADRFCDRYVLMVLIVFYNTIKKLTLIEIKYRKYVYQIVLSYWISL